jgi:release factor glutamine methyltransferase
MATLLAEGARRLRASAAAVGTGATPTLDAELLLAHVLRMPRARLKSHSEALAEPERAGQYLELIERRAAGEPLAYRTGEREFWSLRLAVSPAVLVPRPETELLVERALALWTASAGRIADLGTGCGAIAIALARERPRWQIVATDVSAAALAVAQRNAATFGAGIDFRHGDWYTPLAGERFDLLLSNPPYVAADDPAMHALRYEPRAALTPGSDALECLRTLVRGAPRHLARGGWLLLEHGADQGADVRQELVDAGFRYVRSHCDLAGHERMTDAQYGQI